MVSGKSNEVEDKKLLIAALVILFGGNAGSIIGAFNPDIRSDPFTGTDGAQLREFCSREINELDASNTEIRSELKELRKAYHDHRHEAPPRWVIERLNYIEQELKRLQ